MVNTKARMNLFLLIWSFVSPTTLISKNTMQAQQIPKWKWWYYPHLIRVEFLHALAWIPLARIPELNKPLLLGRNGAISKTTVGKCSDLSSFNDGNDYFVIPKQRFREGPVLKICRSRNLPFLPLILMMIEFPTVICNLLSPLSPPLKPRCETNNAWRVPTQKVLLEKSKCNVNFYFTFILYPNPSS